jgi:hypothetical protein
MISPLIKYQFAVWPGRILGYGVQPLGRQTLGHQPLPSIHIREPDSLVLDRLPSVRPPSGYSVPFPSNTLSTPVLNDFPVTLPHGRSPTGRSTQQEQSPIRPFVTNSSARWSSTPVMGSILFRSAIGTTPPLGNLTASRLVRWLEGTSLW